MNCALVAALSLLSAVPAPQDQDALRQALLDKFKAATVFLQAGRFEGSGFLVHRDGDKGYVVTNNHVVGDAPARRVSVYFNSGTREERVAAGEVLDTDPDNDVAIVSLEMKALPEPFDLQVTAKPRETLPIVICGFPLGSRLRVATKHPGVSITTGTISGVRTSPWTGEKLLIQIQGEAEHGSSGGPVVDREGALVGILSMGIDGTQIRWLRPIEHAQQLWAACERDLSGSKPGEPRLRMPVARAVGRMEVTGTPMTKERVAVGKAWATPLDIPAANVSAALWSDDGSALFVLERDPGILRKIAFPAGKEERLLRLGTECSDLTQSSEGLVLLIPGSHQVWSVGTNMLGVKMKATPQGDFAGVAASTSRSQAYVGQGESLSILDLPTGIVTKTVKVSTINSKQAFKVKRHRSAGPLAAWTHPVLTPDGRYLLCLSSNGLHRFKVADNDLVYEEAGPPIADDDPQFAVSPDSRLVALLPSRAAPADPDKPSRETRLFSIDNLQTPTARIPLMTRAIGFDPAKGGLYVENGDAALIACSPDGKPGATFDVGPTEREGIARILVHPGGRSALVMTPLRILWVELPD